MMKSHLKEHVIYYASLIAIQLVGVTLFFVVAPHRSLQMGVAVFTAFSYTALALIHHKVSHTLTSKIVIEYVLIAALGITLMLIYLK